MTDPERVLEAMVAAGREAGSQEWFEQKPRPDEIWSEMLAAAPKLTGQGE